MKKLLLMSLCGVLSLSLLFAQENKEQKVAFQFSFLPFMSTNGIHAKNYTNYVSINLFTGISKNEKIFTIGGIGNTILNNATGLQIGGFFNYIGNEGKGVLIAGITNVVKNNYNGIQVGGLANGSKNVNGIQIAGLINVAKDVNGFQLGGLMNIAKKVKGVQIGMLLNVAESSEFPIGIINIIKHGEKGIGITYDNLGNIIVAFRSGGKYTYGIIGAGYNHRASKGKAIVAEAGLGVHIPIFPWLRINNEFKGASIGANSPQSVLHAGYALMPSFVLWKHLEIFGGVSINYMASLNSTDKTLFAKHSLWSNYTDTRLQRVYIGYQVGIQVIF